MVDLGAARGVRSGILGRPENAATIGPFTVFDETDPVAAGRTGKLAGRDHAQRGLAYVEGGNWPSGGGIGDNGWRRSSGACRRAM